MSATNKLYKNAIDYKTNLRLSKNFTLSELVRTSKNVDNWPKKQEIIWHLHHLTWFVLQRIRDHYNKPVRVTSGYRSPELNTMIGGSLKSQHSKGQAADFEIKGVDNREVAKWIHKNLVYDQLILEFYDSSRGTNSGWIHCSYKPTGGRRQFLIAKKKNKKTLYLPATIQQLDIL